MSSVERYGRFLEDEGCFELTSRAAEEMAELSLQQGVPMWRSTSRCPTLAMGRCRIREADGTIIHLVGWDAKFVYIRDDETNVTFNPWGVPVHTEVKDRVCRFYREKTEITSTCDDLRVAHRVFCPDG